jgi:hypothetical protein
MPCSIPTAPARPELALAPSFFYLKKERLELCAVAQFHYEYATPRGEPTNSPHFVFSMQALGGRKSLGNTGCASSSTRFVVATN